MSKFKARYEVGDGYVGGSRPRYFNIDGVDIEDNMDDDALREMFEEFMYENFQETVHPYGQNVEEFIQWAKDQMTATAK